MSGRKLQGPFRGRKVESLAEWLAEKAAPQWPPLPWPVRAAPKVGGSTSSTSPPHPPGTPPAAPQASEKEGPSILGSPNGALRRRQQRRRVHPTARGGVVPKLAPVGGSAAAGGAGGGGGGELSEQALRLLNERNLAQMSSVASLETVATVSAGPAVLPGVPSSGGPVMGLPTVAVAPAEQQPVLGGRSYANPVLKRMAHGSGRLHRAPLAAEAAGLSVSSSKRSLGASSSVTGLSSMGSVDEDGALILPRVRSRPVLKSGRVATVHMSQDSSNAALARCLHEPSPKALRSRASVAPLSEGELVDRKWHLRQAPLSAALALGEMDRQPPGSAPLPPPPAPAVTTLARSRTSVAPATAGPPMRRGTLTGGATALGRGGGPTGREYLSFQGWGVDDDYICTLLGRARLGNLRHINLSENRLTEATIKFFVATAKEQPPYSLESLRLASNHFGPAGGRALATLVKDVRPPLQELDLADNGLGDAVCELLCEILAVHCKTLVGLSLARNGIGEHPRGAVALGNFLSVAPQLQAVDLHWNTLQGASGLAVIQGIYDNAAQIDGQLWRVNLAWNRLGARCDESGRVPDCKCDTCRWCSKVVASLASVFADGKVLFHLDLSYNNFHAGDCAILNEGLKKNHTLFGLHFAGNEGVVDDVGFIIPRVPEEPPPPVEQAASEASKAGPCDVRLDLNASVRSTPRRLRLDRVSQFSRRTDGPMAVKAREMALVTSRVNPSLLNVSTPDAFSFNDLEVEKEWAAVHSKVQQFADFGETCRFEDVRINERCCWICENWVEEAIQYIPGWSGPETSMDEVTAVYAYFSVDGFARPTRLSRSTEKYFERHFAAAEEDSRAGGRKQVVPQPSQEGGPKRAPILDKEGRYTAFRGSRMLPPSSVPVYVVFQVNEAFCTARHMHTAPLPEPRMVHLHSDGRNPHELTSSLPPTPAPTGQSLEVSVANVISAGLNAWKRFEQGMAYALAMMEDPRQRGDLLVVPRKLQYETVRQVMEAWRFEKSVFKDYNRDSEKTFAACFDHDYSACKMERWVERNLKGTGQTLVAHMRKRYQYFMAAFHARCFKGFTQPRAIAGLAMSGFCDILSSPSEAAEKEQARYCSQSSDVARPAPGRSYSKSGGRTSVFPLVGPVFNSSFTTSLADTIYVGANIIDKENKLVKDMTCLPSVGMARFQYLEGMFKVALQRFQQTGEQDTALGALKELERVLGIGQDHVSLRVSLMDSLFCEECDLVIQQNQQILEEAYEGYMKRYPFVVLKSASKHMSFGGWLEFLQATGATEAGLAQADMGLAFALGKEVRVDEYRSCRHMELSWAEFLVCVGAVVRLSGDFHPDTFPDRLLAFVEDNVGRAVQSFRHTVGFGPSRNADAATSKLIAKVVDVFELADEDRSGYLTYQEFSQALRRPGIEKEFKEQGISVSDFKVLFKQMDADDSGTVTLDELCDGIVQMKKTVVGLERTIAYMRKVFQESDGDGSGSLSREEFQKLLQNPRIRSLLGQTGISADDIDDLWAAVEAQDDDGQEGVSVEEMIAGLLAMRLDGGSLQRGLNFMRQVFKAAGGGRTAGPPPSLTREQVEASFYSDEVEETLGRLGLSMPDWLGIFDAIDVNGDGELSWQELERALQARWAREQGPRS